MNVDPLCKPQDVSYTSVPNCEPVVVTTYFGLNRYLVGDILQVFYNNTHQFRFVRRKNMVISVDVETTTEEEIMKALTRATFVLIKSLRI